MVVPQVENSELELYIGDRTEYKNLILNYFVSPLIKKWPGAMIQKVNFIIRKLK